MKKTLIAIALILVSTMAYAGQVMTDGSKISLSEFKPVILLDASQDNNGLMRNNILTNQMITKLKDELSKIGVAGKLLTEIDGVNDLKKVEDTNKYLINKGYTHAIVAAFGPTSSTEKLYSDVSVTDWSMNIFCSVNEIGTAKQISVYTHEAYPKPSFWGRQMQAVKAELSKNNSPDLQKIYPKGLSDCVLTSVKAIIK